MIVFFSMSARTAKTLVFLFEPLEKLRKHWKEARIVKLRQFSLDSAADSYTAIFFFSVQIAFARLNRNFLLLLFNVFFVFCRDDLSVESQAFRKREFRETALN